MGTSRPLRHFAHRARRCWRVLLTGLFGAVEARTYCVGYGGWTAVREIRGRRCVLRVTVRLIETGRPRLWVRERTVMARVRFADLADCEAVGSPIAALTTWHDPDDYGVDADRTIPSSERRHLAKTAVRQFVALVEERSPC